MPLKFKDLPVTVMSLNIELEGEIDIVKLFPLLEITAIQMPEKTRKTKKFKIPFAGSSGKVLSLKYEKVTRGIVKTQSEKFFRNCIMIDFSNETKNVNVKLFSKKIQMCGVKSEKQGRESAFFLLQNIHNIENTLKYIQDNPDIARKTLDFIIEKTKSNKGVLISQQGKSIYKQYIDKNFSFYDKVTDNDFPEDCNFVLAEYLSSFSKDYIYHEDLCNHLEWLYTVPTISLGEEIRLKSVSRSMVNYNYDLGVPINRIKFAYEINMFEEYDAQFCNKDDNHVKIRSPLVFGVGETAKGKPKTWKCNKILGYRTGKITHSAPDEASAEVAYVDFVEVKMVKIIGNITRNNKITYVKFVDNEESRNKLIKELIENKEFEKMKDLFFRCLNGPKEPSSNGYAKYGIYPIEPERMKIME